MNEILEALEALGYDERTDPQLYAYLESWLNNNQFMVMEDPVSLFESSRGFVEYTATGIVTPDED